MPVHRLFISLLVHEKPEVILDQLENFKRFAPGCVVVMHLSQGFTPPDEFLDAVKKLGDVRINPVSVPTNKVNLLCPHLENIKLIFDLEPDPEDLLAFHASNDLLVRPGLIDYIQPCTAGYFKDGILDSKRDSSSAAKIQADKDFMDLLTRLQIKTIIWSQVEGAFFKIRHLRQAVEWIDGSGMDMRVKRGYFAEEVILPTLIHKMIGMDSNPCVVPSYVLSEVSFLVKYVEWRRRLFGYTFIALVFGRTLKVLGPRKITKCLVRGIRSGKLGAYGVFGYSNGNLRYNAGTVFGVKRVDRQVDNVLRVYIRSLN
jgi:hypothetical protein